jgi:hypothetical protein
MCACSSCHGVMLASKPVFNRLIGQSLIPKPQPQTLVWDKRHRRECAPLEQCGALPPNSMHQLTHTHACVCAQRSDGDSVEQSWLC